MAYMYDDLWLLLSMNSKFGQKQTKKTNKTRKSFCVCYIQQRDVALPGVPSISFRVKLVRGNEGNIPFHEVCEGLLCLPLNVQLQIRNRKILFIQKVKTELICLEINRRKKLKDYTTWQVIPVFDNQLPLVLFPVYIYQEILCVLIFPNLTVRMTSDKLQT